MSPSVTEAEIRAVGAEVRADHDSDDFVATCSQLANQLCDLLSERFTVTAQTREFRVGEDRVAHIAVVLPLSQYSDTELEYGSLIIDPTISQFSLANYFDGEVGVGLDRASNLPEVGVYLPNCSERRAWYHNRNDSRCGIDPFTTEAFEKAVKKAKTSSTQTTTPEEFGNLVYSYYCRVVDDDGTTQHVWCEQQIKERAAELSKSPAIPA